MISAGIIALAVWLILRSNEKLADRNREDPCLSCQDRVRIDRSGEFFYHVSTGLERGPDNHRAMPRDTHIDWRDYA